MRTAFSRGRRRRRLALALAVVASLLALALLADELVFLWLARWLGVFG